MTLEEAKATKPGDTVVQWSRQARKHERGVVVAPWDGTAMRVRWEWQGSGEDVFVWEPRRIRLVPMPEGTA